MGRMGLYEPLLPFLCRISLYMSLRPTFLIWIGADMGKSVLKSITSIFAESRGTGRGCLRWLEMGWMGLLGPLEPPFAGEFQPLGPFRGQVLTHFHPG